MSKRTLICGSLAYDTIMVFPDRFARHILPEQTHMLSVSFQIGEMRREWGGCAGNIAYNLKALGGEPVVMATLGDDGAPYRERLAALGIASDGVRTMPAGMYTAQAFIITDLDDNQITAFHPGAMNASHENRVGDVEDIALGIVAPDGRDGMRAHVEQFATRGFRSFSIPGQGLPLFSGPELIEMIDAATYLAVNDYEATAPGRAHRAVARGDRGARRRDDRHAGRRRRADPRGRRGLGDSGGEAGGARRSDRLRRRLPGRAPVRDRPRLETGSAPAASRRRWARSRSRSRGGQNHAVSRDAVARLYFEQFAAYPW